MSTPRILAILVISASLAASTCACGAAYKQVTEQDRLAATSYFNIAVNSFSQGQIIDALKALKDATGYNPRDPDVHNLYGYHTGARLRSLRFARAAG